MEWIWYIVASIGAGIGTGLAGLSAATVMVPILIVLCPSFAGENGAYQATAIALASDILGSAVTTFTYSKNKNIDMKRGWLMLVCIISMSTVGSYVAYLAGNVVLGGFTLFLTFCIGIRFLVKPDTSRKEQVSKGEKLDLKGVIISLFFGLTIGFGTGFVGTGGGMMMLVVFTAFLGMELKTAVGTSTFIMTFTALIASVSHIFIHPAIVFEKWPVMLICIVIATAVSLISARFANKVNNRTIGLVTGGFLTILGLSMIILNYWDTLSQITIIVETLKCIGILMAYIVPSVIILLLIYYFLHVKSYIFRKMLHAVAFTCITIMTVTAESWQAAALASVLMAVVIYPLLRLFENESWFGKFFAQKESGEIRKSLLMLFLTFSVVISITWGVFNRPEIAAASILMWGLGDAAAALVGIPLGKHKVRLKGTDGKKSWEGSLSMLCISFVAGLCTLFLLSDLSYIQILLLSSLGSISGTATELFTPSKYDTVTVPIAIMTVLLLLAHLC